MTTRSVPAMYDTRAKAEGAVAALTSELGLTRAAIRISPEGALTDAGYDRTRPYDDTGFFASLKALFVSDKDRYAYAEGMRRGSVLVSATVEEGHIARAIEVLERSGAMDLDATEASWRQSGWTGYDATAHKGEPRPTTTVVPAEESVILHQESVHVERQAVDRAATAGDIAAFRERLIEVRQTAEEAVVGKSVHVIEEIGAHKKATNRVETMSDTVRSAKVKDTTATSSQARPAASPPSTATSHAVDSKLGTNIRGANPKVQQVS